jgi:hypothetical protein
VIGSRLRDCRKGRRRQSEQIAYYLVNGAMLGPVNTRTPYSQYAALAMLWPACSSF